MCIINTQWSSNLKYMTNSLRVYTCTCSLLAIKEQLGVKGYAPFNTHTSSEPELRTCDCICSYMYVYAYNVHVYAVYLIIGEAGRK